MCLGFCCLLAYWGWESSHHPTFCSCSLGS